MNLRDWLVRKLGSDIVGLIEKLLQDPLSLPQSPYYCCKDFFVSDYGKHPDEILQFYTSESAGWKHASRRKFKKLYTYHCNVYRVLERERIVDAIEAKFDRHTTPHNRHNTTEILNAHLKIHRNDSNELT